MGDRFERRRGTGILLFCLGERFPSLLSLGRVLTGEPQSIDKVETIADSLGAPFAMPYSFALTEANVDRLVLVDDTQLRRTMGFLFRTMKIAVEPACAASTAALLGPLREDLRGKRVALVMCGSNIDWDTFEQQVIFDEQAA